MRPDDSLIYASGMNEALLAVLLTLQPYHADNETPEARVERMGVIAAAINYAADRATCSRSFDVEGCKRIYPGSRGSLVSLLVTQGYQESRFAKHVHEGYCGPQECDAHRRWDGQMVHLARSSWQLHWHPSIDGEWRHAAGTGTWETSNASWAAAVAISSHYRRCGSEVGAISGYAGSRSCNWSGAPARLAFARRVEAQLSVKE